MSPAAASEPPVPLRELVRRAVREYAITRGHLAAIFAQSRLPYKDSMVNKMVEMAVKTIGQSVESRGETSYSLVLPSGEPNATRIAAVHRYLQKMVEKQLANMQPMQ